MELCWPIEFSVEAALTQARPVSQPRSVLAKNNRITVVPRPRTLDEPDQERAIVAPTTAADGSTGSLRVKGDRSL